jgi:squalene synthase HpnC
VLRQIASGRTDLPPSFLEPLAPHSAADWDLERAFAYCESLARRHYEEFPVASHFLPGEVRKYIWAIYAFARCADDFADEPAFEGKRAEALDFWESQLNRACHGEADHPVFIALCETLERCDLPVQPFEDMLTAFRMDLGMRRYTTYAGLESYLAHAARPIGRLMLNIFGRRDAALYRYSDDLTCALAQAHFWRDLARDLERDRLYIPLEDLVHFGIDEAELKKREVTPAFRDLMEFLCARTRALFVRSRPVVEKVGPEFATELSMIWHSGLRVLDGIESVDYDVFNRRPALSYRAVARAAAHGVGTRRPAAAAGGR